jgi:hypothetical protein
MYEALVEETIAEMTMEKLFYFVGLAVRTHAARKRGSLRFCGCALCH